MAAESKKKHVSNFTNLSVSKCSNFFYILFFEKKIKSTFDDEKL